MKPTFVLSNSCKRQLRQRWQRSQHIVIVCMARKTKMPSLAKRMKSTIANLISTARCIYKAKVKLHVQLQLQQQMGEQLQNSQGPQSMCGGYKAILYIATKQSSLPLQSKLKKAVQDIKERKCIVYKKLGNRSKLCIRRRISHEYQSTGAEHTKERNCRGGQRRHF